MTDVTKSALFNPRAERFLEMLRPLGIVIVGLGLFLRICEYVADRSFWADEAWVAVNILGRSWENLFDVHPFLNDITNRPPIFVLLVKASVTIWGNTESSFRLWPLVCGLSSVVLFGRVCRHFLARRGLVLAALAIFSMDSVLIRYAAELKPYACDVFVVLALMLVFLRARGPRDIWVAGGVFAAAFWASYPAIFCVVPMLVIWGWRFGSSRTKVPAVLAAVLLSATSFLWLYHFSIARSLDFPPLMRAWEGDFLPVSLGWGPSIVWFKEKVVSAFVQDRGPFGMVMAGLAMLGVLRMGRLDPARCGLLVGPALLALVASAMRKYPFSERLLLFLYPAYLILMMRGAEVLLESGPRWRRSAGVLVLAVMIISQGTEGMTYTMRPQRDLGAGPAMRFFTAHVRPGDAIFLNRDIQNTYWYYLGRFGDTARLGGVPVAWGGKPGTAVEIREVYNDLVEYGGSQVSGFRPVSHLFDDQGHIQLALAAKGKKQFWALRQDTISEEIPRGRVWVLFTDLGGELEPYWVSALDRSGERQAFYKTGATSVYLYRLPAVSR